GGRLAELAGRSVLIAVRDQFAAAIALIELDGIASRLILCPPDLPPEHLASVVAGASVDAIVSDHDRGDDGLDIPLQVHSNGTVAPATETPAASRGTEWVLLTSGTTGAPKMLVHSFRGLTAALDSALGRSNDLVWGTFYDIRRYG